MVKINIILFIYFLTLIYFIDGVYNKYASTGMVSCYILEQNNNVKIYTEAKEFLILQYDSPYFLQIGTLEYDIDFCECDANDGTCKMSFISQQAGVNYKLILNFHFNEDKKINIIGNSFKDIVQQENNNPQNQIVEDNQVNNVDYCKDENILYMKNIYYQNENLNKFYGISYMDLNSLIENDFKFPLIHAVKKSTGTKNQYTNEIVNVIGTYDITGVVHCSSSNNNLPSSKTERIELKKEGYNPQLPSDCSWGNSNSINPENYYKNSNSDVQCNKGFSVLPNQIIIFSLCSIYFLIKKFF